MDCDKKENETKYGEFVCTEFKWLPLDRQKENAIKFEKITKPQNEINNEKENDEK